MIARAAAGFVLLIAFGAVAKAHERPSRADHALIEESVNEGPLAKRQALKRQMATMSAADRVPLIAAMEQNRERMPHQPPPDAYLRTADRQRARQKRWEDICLARRGRTGGISTISFYPTDQCYRMSAPKRMRGVWVYEFEGSEFYPGRDTRPPRHTLENYRSSWDGGPLAYWLSSNMKLVDGHPLGQVFLIEFVGRQTPYRWHYGHFGGFDYEVVVDRVISLKQLE